MEDIKNIINLVQVGLVVIEILGVENGNLTVPVNSTPMYSISILTTNTRSCVLIIIIHFISWLVTSYIGTTGQLAKHGKL